MALKSKILELDAFNFIMIIALPALHFVQLSFDSCLLTLPVPPELLLSPSPKLILARPPQLLLV